MVKSDLWFDLILSILINPFSFSIFISTFVSSLSSISLNQRPGKRIEKKEDMTLSYLRTRSRHISSFSICIFSSFIFFFFMTPTLSLSRSLHRSFPRSLVSAYILPSIQGKKVNIQSKTQILLFNSLTYLYSFENTNYSLSGLFYNLRAL